MSGSWQQVALSLSHAAVPDANRGGLWADRNAGLLQQTSKWFGTDTEFAVKGLSGFAFPVSAEYVSQVTEGSIAFGSGMLLSGSDSLTGGSEFYASDTQPPTDGAFIDSHVASNLLERLPGFVESDQVIDVGISLHDGYVYDLTTKPHWFITGEIVTHNCVFASSGHATMVQSALSGKLIMPTTDQCLKAYSAVTGFNPNDPNSDQGAVEVDALNWERRHSLAGTKVYAFARVDPHDHALLRACAYYFGGVWFGINLPISAQNQVGKVWDVTDPSLSGDAEPGSWGGHAVFAPKYDPDSLTCMTWTVKQPMTNAFIDAYADEAWVRLPSEWERERDPFQALKWADLKAAVAQFGPVDPRQ
jgi:hypothetical protein